MIPCTGISVQELSHLPLRALIAFCARRARNVAPLFEFMEGDPDVVIIKMDLEDAIQLIGKYGTGER